MGGNYRAEAKSKAESETADRQEAESEAQRQNLEGLPEVRSLERVSL